LSRGIEEMREIADITNGDFAFEIACVRMGETGI
jgi:hypothetical protein